VAAEARRVDSGSAGGLRVETQLPGPGGGRPYEPPPPRGDEGGTPGALGDTRFVGLLAFLGTVTMLFVGFTSSYMLRRASPDWAEIAAPRLLWVNTALLLASSLALEWARRALKNWDLAGTQRAFGAAGLLGLGFVAGQFGAWRQLAEAGVFMASNPHSAFFYMLTGVHVLHVAGGLGWYLLLAAALGRGRLERGGNGLGLFALYWHFLGGLWAYLLVLLFVI
jgi:cytochrome c oxidase subunit 3